MSYHEITRGLGGYLQGFRTRQERSPGHLRKRSCWFENITFLTGSICCLIAPS
jgi:hypothetical protein